MEKWIQIGKKLLFPPLALALILVPVATAFLVYAMVVLGTESVAAIVSYVLAAYTLTVWCVRVPRLIAFFKTFRQENPYVRRWRGDVRLRMNVSLWGGFLWNGAYGIFQLCLGAWHRSFWFVSLGIYYIFLGIMRFSLGSHTRKHAPGEEMELEIRKYRSCGIIFLVVNLALTLMIFFMVYWNRTFHHHEITTIAMAAYTFTTFTVAIVNIVRYRKLGSPVFSASKAISLAAACVSMLTLESTMLTTFGKDTMNLGTRRIFLGFSGGAISVFIIAMAIYMIVKANKALKKL